MNDKALRILEYHKIISLLAEKASSAPGKELCQKLAPMTSLAALEEAQQQTADAFTRLVKGGRIHFSGNKDISLSIKSLEIGSALSAAELMKISASLACATRAKTFARSDHDEEIADSLQTYFANLEPLTPLQNELNRCIISEEEIADDASSALKHIRRSIQLTNEKIHSQLTNMVNGSYRTYLQDAVITMRNNRYCIPVKSEHKGNVPGMIHDQSSTGSTLFIEPAVIVNLNNQLKELALKEKDEIERILAELSALAGEHTEELSNNFRLLTKLDFIFAKAGLAFDMNASRPLFNNNHYINIRKGRHPLLDKKKVVPIDIHLGKEFDLLIVTGPNTGGKTVSLKTVGLFTLMGQSGLHIPALDRSELGVFTEVYADIGDEQSIEQNLSTFSAHMTNTISILKNADENALCIFDELGAGTDPTEGAALAIAILKHLHDKGIRTMATTHYSELKVFALTTSYVENACCEFDVESLRPTYRLLIGVPGKSNAFAISRRLGLEGRIVDRAGELVNEENSSFEQVIERLEERRREMENELEAARKAARQARETMRQSEARQAEAGQRAKREIDQAREEASRIVQKTRQQADALLNELDELRRQQNKALSAEQKARLRSGLRELESSADPVRKRRRDDYQLPRELRPGDSVVIFDIDKAATVLEAPKDGQVLVQAGIIKTRVQVENLRLSGEGQKAKAKPGRSVTKNVSAPEIATSLDLRGMNVEEGLMEVDAFLDRAARSHVPQVTIIHGKGTGVLRAAVQQHLRRCSQVKSFRLGAFGEGESGVTVVEMK